MQLRPLQPKDAPFMLEWMHDENVTSCLAKDFSSMTLENCQSFIADAADMNGAQDMSVLFHRHYAIADDHDEYMGTISLKNIDTRNARAEYAVSCRTKAMGKGFAKAASEALFNIARKQYGLSLLYLDVYPHNVRARKLYVKLGFTEMHFPSFLKKEDYDPALLWFQKKLSRT